MDPQDKQSKQYKTDLESINTLLSHLHTEVSTLEIAYSEVLNVLRNFDHLAHVDELTGLLRRRAFFKKWEDVLARCQALNENCGVLLIDVDHFKRVNDTHGHAAGDEVLKRVGDLLKQFDSQDVITGRLGGEEFVVAIKGSEEKIKFMAEHIRQRAQQGTGTGSPSEIANELSITVSIGAASAQKNGYDATRLLAIADEKMYEAKNAGRNQVKVA